MERARACFTDSRRAAVECNESLVHALRMTGDGVTPAVIAPFMKCFHATLASMHTMLNAVAGTQLQITPKDYSDLSGFYNFIAQNWRVQQPALFNTGHQVLQRTWVELLALAVGLDEDLGNGDETHGSLLAGLVEEKWAWECRNSGRNP